MRSKHKKSFMLKRLPRPDFGEDRVITVENRQIGIRLICGKAVDKDGFAKITMAQHLASAFSQLFNEASEHWRVFVVQKPPFSKAQLETITLSEVWDDVDGRDVHQELAWFWNWSHSRGEIRERFYNVCYKELKDRSGILCSALSKAYLPFEYKFTLLPRAQSSHLAVAACLDINSLIILGDAFDKNNRDKAVAIAESLNDEFPDEPQWQPSVIERKVRHNPSTTYFTLTSLSEDVAYFSIDKNANFAGLVLSDMLRTPSFRAIFDAQFREKFNSAQSNKNELVDDESAQRKAEEMYREQFDEEPYDVDEDAIRLKAQAIQDAQISETPDELKPIREIIDNPDDFEVLPISQLMQTQDDLDKPISLTFTDGRTYHGLPQDDLEDDYDGDIGE